MQNISDFYNKLTALNIGVNLIDDNLEVFFEEDTQNINEYLTLIKENKTQLLDFLTKRKKNLNDIPLSPAQRNILFKCLQGESSSYNMSRIFKVDQSFSNIEKIRESFRYIINKHEALRMRLSNKNGKYFFIVDRDSSQVDIFDNIEYSLVTHYVYSEFDLENNLVKLGIFKNENETFLCLVLHHIIGDDKSLSIIQKDFLDFINGALADDILDEHFTDYLTYLQNEKETINKSKSFWVEKMSNIKRNGNNSFNIMRKDEIRNSKSEYFSFKLKNKIQRNLFSRIIASISYTIKDIFSKPYVVYTIPFSTRETLSHHQQVGYYINQLPLGIDSDSCKIKDLIINVRNEIFEYNDHKLYPFSSIMSGIGVSPELFNISVVLLNEISESIEDNRFEAVKSEVIQNVSLKNDIAFEFLYNESGTALTLHVEYNYNFIETSNMEKLINKVYEHLLKTDVNTDSSEN